MLLVATCSTWVAVVHAFELELSAAHLLARIQFIRKRKILFVGVLSAVCTCLYCRRPAFWKFAVTEPTVLSAGQELADHWSGAT